MVLPASDHPIFQAANEIRQALMARDALLLNDVIRMYGQAYKRLKRRVDELAKRIGSQQPTQGQLQEMASFQNLMDGIRSEMNKFAGMLGSRLEEATRQAIREADADALRMVQAWLPGMEPGRLKGTFASLAPNQVYAMYGFTDPDGLLYTRIQANFSLDVANLVRDELLSGYLTGMNPRAVARMIRKALGGGLNWALNTARTAHLWAYRAASHLSYANNSHVIKGWVWHANLGDDRTCMSCINQHGSFHSLHEILCDHHKGRCTPLPVTKSYEELGIEGITERPLELIRGADWFANLPAAMQQALMGGAKWRAWQDGAFDFDQLSRSYFDPLYGRMLREASLSDILRERAAVYYERSNARL